jgi:hypothetical protein
MAKFDPKAKAKRQKIIAAVLAVVLVGVLAYELPSVLKQKKPPTSSVAAPPAAPVPAPGPVAATGTPVPAAGSTTLVDSDPAAKASTGQLVSFDRFATKDPFVQPSGTQACEGDSCSVAKAVKNPAPAALTAKTSARKGTATAKQPAARRSSAKISVNGAAETVGVSENFPQSDPVFVLVSLTKTTAKIGIAGGSLAGGAQTVTLRKGKKVTLMNTADGTRYELLLISVS